MPLPLLLNPALRSLPPPLFAGSPPVCSICFAPALPQQPGGQLVRPCRCTNSLAHIWCLVERHGSGTAECRACGSSFAVQRKPVRWHQAVLNLAAAGAVLVLAAVTVGKLAGTRNGGRQAAQERRVQGEAQHAAQEQQRQDNGMKRAKRLQQAARQQQQRRASPPGEPASRPAARRIVEDFECDAVTGDWFAAGWLHLHGGQAGQGGGQRSSHSRNSQWTAPPALKAPWLPR